MPNYPTHKRSSDCEQAGHDCKTCCLDVQHVHPNEYPGACHECLSGKGICAWMPKREEVTQCST